MDEKKDAISKDFDAMFKTNVNEFTDKKKNGTTTLTYLSWAWAWALFKKNFPDASYEIKHWDGKPYLDDSALGYMVETSITAGGMSYTMWLPVMDNTNRAMRSTPYTVKVKDFKTGGFVDKIVNAATMFDINTAIMRCLVKNMAMFGLGLYIYAGEDVPEGETVKDVDVDAAINKLTAALPEEQFLLEWLRKQTNPQQYYRAIRYQSGYSKSTIDEAIKLMYPNQ